MNILIFSDDYPPNWAPRIGYLVKYLSRSGFFLYVVSGVKNTKSVFNFLEGYAEEVHFVKEVKLRRYDPRNLLEYFLARRESRGELKMEMLAIDISKRVKFDLILTTTCDITPTFTAHKISQKLKIPLIVDFRDMPEQLPNDKIRSIFSKSILNIMLRSITYPFYKSYRKYIVKAAGATTTISPFHYGILNEISGNCNLIYNGFDKEIFFHKPEIRTEKFHIVYTGTIGNATDRNPDYFLQALKKLADDGVISPLSLQCKFYCGNVEGSDLFLAVKKLKLTNYFDFKEYVAADKVPEVLHSASILLLLSNKVCANGPKGVLQTKFFEYLAVNKPLLCTSSDEDQIEDIINTVGAGVSARSAGQAYDFILQNYKAWKLNGCTKGSADMDKINFFSREKQAYQFIELFKRVVKDKSL